MRTPIDSEIVIEHGGVSVFLTVQNKHRNEDTRCRLDQRELIQGACEITMAARLTNLGGAIQARALRGSIWALSRFATSGRYAARANER